MVGLLMVGLLLVTGCAASPFTKNETPGQHFDRSTKEFAANCAKAKLRPNDRSCDRLKLKPADPLATEEGRFAHSIKIPNPVPADSGYRPGMTPEQYFDHLCKTEAGEFIYKTVENVEGIYMMRPRKEATDYELEHLYALEDPYGDVAEGGGAGQKSVGVFLGPSRYQYVEMPDVVNRDSRLKATLLRRYAGEEEKKKQKVTTELRTDVQSRYGYTWRGLSRPHDRELGIAGGELIILDRDRDEILAVWRGFIRSSNIKNLTGIWWLRGQMCPLGKPGRPDLYGFDFVMEVLRPGTQQTKRFEGEHDAK